MTPQNYRKIEIDNVACNRRFHVAFEEGNSQVVPQVRIECPHCGVVIFEAHNHPVAALVREENLVKSPDGSNPMIYDCHFAAK